MSEPKSLPFLNFIDSLQKYPLYIKKYKLKKCFLKYFHRQIMVFLKINLFVYLTETVLGTGDQTIVLCSGTL